jgi:hypothetical protein
MLSVQAVTMKNFERPKPSQLLITATAADGALRVAALISIKGPADKPDTETEMGVGRSRRPS